MSRILILAHYFYPSSAVGAKRMAELACYLRDRKYEVTVVSGIADAVPELADRIYGIELKMVPLPPKLYPIIAYWPKRLLKKTRARHGKPSMSESVKNGVLATGADKKEGVAAWFKRHYHAIEGIVDESKLWSFMAFLRVLWLRKSFDWIISSGPPHSLHLTAWLLSNITHAKWIMDLRDPWVCNHDWPDKEKSSSRLRDRIERFLERKCVGSAHSVTTASPGIASALLARIPEAADKVTVVLNGYDQRVENKAGGSGRLRLLYAGSLYLNRNPFPLLAALHGLLELPHVERTLVSFVLVGLCSSWNGHDLTTWIREKGMQDVVSILPPVAPAEVRAMMLDADVLVNFAQGQPEQIPAKLYDYIAAGREMLLIAESNSDAARVTLESGMGRIVEPHDEAGLRATLQELYAFYVQQGRTFEPDETRVKRFSREYQNKEFEKLLMAHDATCRVQNVEDL